MRFEERDRRIAEWIAEWGRIWGLPGLDEVVRIEPGPRLRRSLGRCQPSTGLIRIHPLVVEGDESFFREVLCHEVAHVAVHRLYGPRVRPHGTEWARLMRVAGYEPHASVRSERLPEALRESMAARTQWLHRCPVCDVSHAARRPVRRWRCRTCWDAGRDGRLEIRRMPARGEA